LDFAATEAKLWVEIDRKRAESDEEPGPDLMITLSAFGRWTSAIMTTRKRPSVATLSGHADERASGD